MTYSKEQLDAFWAQYVTMRAADVAYLTVRGVGYDANFAAMLNYVYANQLYGFDPSIEGLNAPIGTYGRSPVVSGPIKS